MGSSVHKVIPFLHSRQIVATCSNTLVALSLVSSGIGIHITDKLGAQSGALKHAKIIDFEPSKKNPDLSLLAKKISDFYR